MVLQTPLHDRLPCPLRHMGSVQGLSALHGNFIHGSTLNLHGNFIHGSLSPDMLLLCEFDTGSDISRSCVYHSHLPYSTPFATSYSGSCTMMKFSSSCYWRLEFEGVHGNFHLFHSRGVPALAAIIWVSGLRIKPDNLPPHQPGKRGKAKPLPPSVMLRGICSK